MEYAVAFPPYLRATFWILSKLDHSFASLICGHDVETGEPLPGSQGDSDSGRMTITEMIRCRSLVEHTRDLMAAIVVSDADSDDGASDDAGIDEEEKAKEDEVVVDDNRHHWDDVDSEVDVLPSTGATQIYKNTIDQLGQRLRGDVRELDFCC